MGELIELHPLRFISPDQEIEHLKLVETNIDQAVSYMRHALDIALKNVTPDDAA